MGHQPIEGPLSLCFHQKLPVRLRPRLCVGRELEERQVLDSGPSRWNGDKGVESRNH
jgi:hypothetical protein